MSEPLKQAAMAKTAIDTATATAASVGVMTFMGVSLSNWVLILTCVWFLILIAKWFATDMWPMIVEGEHWLSECIRKFKNRKK